MRFHNPAVVASLEAALNPTKLFWTQPRSAASPVRFLQSAQSALLQLLCPTTDRLPMHSHPSRDFRRMHSLTQQFRCLATALLQTLKVPTYGCWISHATDCSRKTS